MRTCVYVMVVGRGGAGTRKGQGRVLKFTSEHNCGLCLVVELVSQAYVGVSLHTFVSLIIATCARCRARVPSAVCISLRRSFMDPLFCATMLITPICIVLSILLPPLFLHPTYSICLYHNQHNLYLFLSLSLDYLLIMLHTM